MSWLRTRECYEKEEAEVLAPFAMKSAESQGRLVSESEHPHRTAFQRDRDRVIHCRAFRRLEYKTQVFVFHEDDHYRNRLTHTLEGAQVARTVARALRLNEDLAEAVALAHDLGHTPFGHAGERVLAELMKSQGGFDHNRQSLRVVDLLEELYADVPGLNLTVETREGILKHGCSWEHPLALPNLGARRGLEAQVADAADEIAYIHHDLDDGLRSGILDYQMLEAAPLWCEAVRAVEDRLAGAQEVCERVLRAQTLITLINGLVTDLIENTARCLEDAQVRCPDDVRAHPHGLVGFSSEIELAKLDLKQFLLDNLYQHAQVRRATRRAEWVVNDLFRTYLDDPSLLADWTRSRWADEGRARTVADYVACMTDRFAIAEHGRLVEPRGAI
jgi:dGTPase